MASEMSRVNNFCCECAATQSRCSADNCPCVAARKTCDEHCESTRITPGNLPFSQITQGRLLLLDLFCL
ncbi:hypothetical protein ANCDUO_05489 [Ancylostoma duodenale]|uniref:Uncharacterized protein n=1 Tax=Ancylostoma duodenale TaxID=51022 RepID=A0A0C2DND6_9BILA|nr:hypothetical protein ANCDUO_05489 [Ancylostoma duodenale]